MHPPGLGEPRDAPGPAGATSITPCRARSRVLFKPHLQPLGSAFIIHLNSTSLVRARGCFVEVGFHPAISQEPPG